MKYITLLVCISILLFPACDKEEVIVIPIYEAGTQIFGWSTAKKNNADFEASGEARIHTDKPDEYFGLFFGTFTKEGFWREQIALNEIKYEVGEYRISGDFGDIYDGFIGADYGTLQDDGDVIGDRYDLDESSDNKLTITVVDTISNIVAGTYHLRFKIRPGQVKSNPDNPDNVVFSEGVFEVSFAK